MSKNPYFAHLPTWRNRQDLAFALDNLPRVIETMSTAPPRPHHRPASTSSASPSLSSPSSPATGSSPSSALSSSPASSLSPSPASSITSPFLTSAASKPTSQTFKGQLMLDLAKECHRSRSRSCSVACSAPSTLSQPRRISSSSQHHDQQLHLPHHSPGVSGTLSGLTNSNTHYPLQFSTRAKAMAFLIEVLQSLQKEPCGCDLTKGCYCPGQDGIEDHEGKSPCYVCGEWFPDRREMGDAPAQVQGGRAWHEQGSLRHHVAESRVKKWLDIVWRPPLKPATTPDPETAHHFGLSGGQEEDLSQYPQQTPLVLSPHPGIWSQHPFDQQHQQNLPRMDPGRPWSVHDIENDARVKSRSRQNSFSSSSSSSSSTTTSSPSASASSSLSSRASSLSMTNLQHHQDQYGAHPRSGYGDAFDQRDGSLSISSHAVDGRTVQARSMDPSTPTSARTPFPFDPHPWDSSCIDPSLGAPPFLHPAASRPARTRTQSCFDPQSGGPGSQLSSSSFTPPVSRPSSSNSNHHRRNKPTRAATTNSTFAIPQEILDPNYRSPTFRIKSWNPPPSSTRQDPTMEGARTLDGQREGTVPFTDLMVTSAPESVGRSDATLEAPLDQQGVAAAAVAVAVGTAAGMERDRTDATVLSTTTPAPSFQFNFTSERFKAAVQQAASSAEKDGSVEVHPVLDPITLSTNASPSSSSSSSAAADEKPMSSPVTSVQKSAALVELEGVLTVVQEFERCDIKEPMSICTEDSPDIVDTDAVNQGRDATAAVAALRSTTTDHPMAPLLSQLGTMKDESDTSVTAPVTAAAADGAAAAAANLAGLLSMSMPPRSMSSLSITADLIQKSAPMSPMSFNMPKHKQRQAVQGGGQDLARANAVSTSRGSSVSVPTSPVSLGAGSESGMATATATATGVGHKVAGWWPLQRWIGKITKSSNESVKPSMPRGGRMHLESS